MSILRYDSFREFWRADRADRLDNLTTSRTPSTEQAVEITWARLLPTTKELQQQSTRASVEGYGMAALATAVCGCGWDVGLAVPVLTVGHRGESLDGVRRLSVSDNQSGYQSRDMEWRMAAAV